MHHISKERLVATDVLIEFEDGPVSFAIPRGATLADISENLNELGKWHKGQPLSIDVRFRAPQESGSSRVPAHPLISSPVSTTTTAGYSRSMVACGYDLPAQT
ncbi:MAG: hypothetical protein ACLP7P_08890 [Rhodomicrobium sp.]